MSTVHVVAGLVALGLCAYLALALSKPEWFA